MSSKHEPGILDELSELFAQERIACDRELEGMDLSALAAQALDTAGLGAPQAGDALDLELQDLFSVERANAMQEAKAALLPTAPGVTAASVAKASVFSRMPIAAKWAAGLSCAAGLAAVSSAAIEGKSLDAWMKDRVDAATSVFMGPLPVQVIAPQVASPKTLIAETRPPAKAPRLVPEVPKAPHPSSAPDPKPVPKKTDARHLTLEQRLRRLEAQAQKAWQSKDRAQAEQKFKAIVALAPQSSFAQWAWGDLFLLAKQSKDRGKRRKLWKQYLIAHPAGRFADAAFGGLCATQHGDAKPCWGEYLEKFPDGAFARKAMREHSE